MAPDQTSYVTTRRGRKVSQRAANRRIRLLGVVLALALAGALARAAWVQVVRAGSLSEQAQAQQTGTSRSLPAEARFSTATASSWRRTTTRRSPSTPTRRWCRSTARRRRSRAQAAQRAGIRRRAARRACSRRSPPATAASPTSRGRRRPRRQGRSTRLNLAGFGHYSDPKRIYPQGIARLSGARVCGRRQPRAHRAGVVLQQAVERAQRHADGRQGSMPARSSTCRTRATRSRAPISRSRSTTSSSSTSSRC